MPPVEILLINPKRPHPPRSLPRYVDVLQRNLQSTVRWACLAPADRAQATHMLAEVLGLPEGALRDILGAVGVVEDSDIQPDVMHNLKSAHARVFYPHTLRRKASSVPLCRTADWPDTVVKLRANLAAFLDEHLRSWMAYVAQDDPPSPASAEVIRRRLLVSAPALRTLIAYLKESTHVEA